MRILWLASIVGAALVVVGCSSLTVGHDFDSQADFATYRTCAWLEQPDTAAAGDRAAQRLRTLLDAPIKSAIESELAAKGVTLVPENPDVLVSYHMGVDAKIDVKKWGYVYPRYPYAGWEGGRVDVYDYREGTLIVDLIDARSRQLVWRGTATKVIDETESPEAHEANIADVVTRMFAKYPPR